jgi:hypothetical protein
MRLGCSHSLPFDPLSLSLSPSFADTDTALVRDSDFKRYVEIYASSQEAFFADYSEVPLSSSLAVLTSLL